MWEFFIQRSNLWGFPPASPSSLMLPFSIHILTREFKLFAEIWTEFLFPDHSAPCGQTQLIFINIANPCRENAARIWTPLSSRPSRQLILVILGICQNCLVWTKEITTEEILFEYSRRFSSLFSLSWRSNRSNNTGAAKAHRSATLYIWSVEAPQSVGHRADARSRGQKLCCGRPQRGLLGRYRPQSAVSCSTLRERAAWSSPSASQVSYLQQNLRPQRAYLSI